MKVLLDTCVSGKAAEALRHRPESTVLYQTVAEHWPAFIERAEEHGGPQSPAFQAGRTSSAMAR